MTPPRPSPETIAQAAYWAAQLATDEATQADRDACEAWCREHPSHLLAMDRMRSLNARIDDTDEIGRRAIAGVIRQRSRDARRFGGLTAALVLLIGGGWLTAQSLTVRAWFPHYETGRGEQRSITLAEGSGVTLDTDAAFDFDRSAGKRRVTLFRGQMLARVAKDRLHPFVVETPEGTATALGTAFTVRRDEGAMIVTVIESRVRACPAQRPDDCADLAPGDQVRMSAGGLARLGRVDPESSAIWAEGWLAADDRPVAAVLAELNRYRRQPVSFDAADLAGMRVSGSFPLGDPDRALKGIVQSTGLRLARGENGAPDVRRAK